MKWTFPVLAFATAASAFAVTAGDSLDSVLAKKGKPSGIMSGGTLQILSYPDAVVKVRDGVVVSVLPPDKPHGVLGVPAPAQTAVAAQQIAIQKVAASPSVAPDDGHAVWESDMGAALEQAKARKCHVLVLFTGSDWCTWCQRMDAEVYSRPEFAAYAHGKFVLLKLDYPHHSAQPDDVRLQNMETLHRFGINGFPNALILDQNENTVAQFQGYRPGGPENFIHMMQAYE